MVNQNKFGIFTFNYFRKPTVYVHKVKQDVSAKWQARIAKQKLQSTTEKNTEAPQEKAQKE